MVVSVLEVSLLAMAVIATGLALVLVWLRRVWFYRDPPRIPPAVKGSIVAPADGQVVYVRPFRQGKVEAVKLGTRIPLKEILKAAPQYGQEGWILGIYMSPLDVHFNYAPISGRLTQMYHVPASFNLPMVDLWEYIRLTYLRKAVDLFGRKHHLENERLTMFLEGDGIRLATVEIADKFVNKITRFVEPGMFVKQGQKTSFIGRGSQVDLVLFGQDFDIKVKVGDRVRGAETIVALPQDNARSTMKG